MRKIFKKVLSFVLGIVLCTGLLPVSMTNAATAMTFDHFDIQSAASFAYKDANGVTQTVNINFYDNSSELGNVKLYKKNLDGTREEIAVSGSWQNASGYGQNAKKEYRIRGNFQRYYNDNVSDGEVVYIFEYYLRANIGGQTETLVYTNEYSYSSDNNVCPGRVDVNKGIDVELSGNDLNDYFSPALKIVKIVDGSSDGKIFTFNLSNDDGLKTVPVATTVVSGVNSGSTIAGGFTAGKSYTISENLIEGYKIKTVKIDGAEAEANSDGSYTFVADRNGGTTVIEFTNAELTSVQVEKIWSNNVPDERKDIVTVELYANGNSANKLIELSESTGWKGEFGGLDKYDSAGNTISYTVKEVKIGNEDLSSDGTLIVYDNTITNGDLVAVAGKYVSTVNGAAITNGWTPATNEDDNSDKITLDIKKVGAEDESVLLNGAEFTLTKNGTKVGSYTTDENGEISLTDLAEGTYTLTETKAPVDYLALKEDITITVTREHKLVSVDVDALKNTYHNEFEVKVDDPNNSSYNSAKGEITIKNELETIEVNVEKKWLNTESALPNYVEVQLYGDGKKVGESVQLSTSNDWAHTWNDLRKSVDGEDVEYVVKETRVFGAEEGFIVYGTEEAGDEKEVKGKWNVSDENNAGSWTITNSWVSANYRFDGSTDFYIKKIDKDGNPLAGVEFEINGEMIPTNESGMIKVSIPEELTVRDGTKNYEIQEVKTQDGYDLDSGVANLEVKIESAFAGFDNNSFTNIFSKKFTFTASGNENYIWNPETRTFVLKNNRSVAESLTIEKIFDGVTKEALANNGLSFTISGPVDFETRTINFGDFVVDGNKATYVLEKVPTGKYTVKENNEQIDNFTLTVSGDNEEKTVESKSKVVFTIKNEYKAEETQYTVIKVWDDNHDQDGKRPGALTINLLADGEVIKTESLTSENEPSDEELEGGDLNSEDVWSYTWYNLPIADENAKVISYSVEEELESEDYKQAGALGDAYTTTLTNVHEPELINQDDDDPENDGKLVVTKVWVDGDDSLKTRPSSITIYLYANDEEIDSAVVVPDKDGNWVYTFNNLYKYASGEEITYNIEEAYVDGYETEIDDVSLKNGFTITNISTDPCAFGGCGSMDIPEAPNTGRLTNLTKNEANDSANMNIMIAITTIILGLALAGMSLLVKRK